MLQYKYQGTCQCVTLASQSQHSTQFLKRNMIKVSCFHPPQLVQFQQATRKREYYNVLSYYIVIIVNNLGIFQKTLFPLERQVNKWLLEQQYILRESFSMITHSSHCRHRLEVVMCFIKGYFLCGFIRMIRLLWLWSFSTQWSFVMTAYQFILGFNWSM